MRPLIAIARVVILEMIRRKDVYVLLFLTALITLLLGSVNLFGEDKIARYLKEACLTLIWVSSLVIAIATAARQIPGERESRTLFPLLAKPVTRTQVVLGKFLGCWFACGLALLAFYAFFCVTAGIREHELRLLNYAQAMLLHWVMLGVVVAMTLLGSVVFAAPSSNATIGFITVVGILGLGRHLFKISLGLPEPARGVLQAMYYAIPHFEFFDLRDLVVHNWPVAPWSACALVVGYAAVYMALFLGAACLRLRRQTIT